MVRFQDPQCTIFVKNIETRVTEEHLWELFLQAGPLRNVSIPKDRATGNPRGFAFVTYRDEVSVPYACELFNSIRLFKRSIYCQPSNNRPSGNASQSSPGSSFNQSPSNRSNSTTNTPPQSPSPNRSFLDGMFNRSSSTPMQSSTPFQGKRKFEDTSDGRFNSDSDMNRNRPYSDNKSNGRSFEERSDRGRFSNSDERDRGRFNNNSDERDRGRYNSPDNRERNTGDRDRGRYDESFGTRSEERDGDRSRRYEERSPGHSPRYDRSSSVNSSYGGVSPMHMQAVNQSFNQQYARQSSSPVTSSFGPIRNDSAPSHRQGRKQKSQPY